MSWIIFAIVCIAVFAIGGSDLAPVLGVSSDHLWNSFIYPFAHASWLHLGINMFSIGLMVRPICKLWQRKYNDCTHVGARLFAWSYAAAVLSGLICAEATPTVGASGMIFFLLGVLLLLNPTRRQFLNYLWIVAAVCVQWYFGKSNVVLHVVAFVEGALLITLKEFLIQYKSGVNRGIYTD